MPLRSLYIAVVLLTTMVRPEAQIPEPIVIPRGPEPLVGAKVPRQIPTEPLVPTFDRLLARYRGGDRAVVVNTLKSREDFGAFRQSFDEATRGRPDWDFVRAAFILEIAIAAADRSPNELFRFLVAGQRYVATRSVAIDRADIFWRFEVLWHQLALALLQRVRNVDGQTSYLDALDVRYCLPKIQKDRDAICRRLAREAVGPADTSLDARFVLARAIVSEQTCWPHALRGVVATKLWPAIPPDDNSKLANGCRDAVRLFDRATAWPDVAVEAGVRAARTQFKLGLHGPVLARVLSLQPADVDAERDYWLEILRGRTLHHAKRLPEAEGAYRSAAAIWPQASTPGIGLGLVLFDMNRRDDALAAATAVRLLPVAAEDPWWTYIRADGRFVGRWRADLLEFLR